uniref:Uncharacterized protein n=1 Tax=Trichuris muris TaxID=70415 RepID=A0A5S6QVM7_TRIMR
MLLGISKNCRLEKSDHRAVSFLCGYCHRAATFGLRALGKRRWTGKGSTSAAEQTRSGRASGCHRQPGSSFTENKRKGREELNAFWHQGWAGNTGTWPPGTIEEEYASLM